jgi:hypothetical protein
MATPMHVYAEIAARYGVDPSDISAVQDFFAKRLPAEPQVVQDKVLAELLARDGELPLEEQSLAYRMLWTCLHPTIALHRLRSRALPRSAL